MTAHITQQVVSRRRQQIASSKKFFTSHFSERGSVNHGTVTIIFSCLAISIVSLLGFFYLQQVIGTASQGTDIHTLQAQIGSLKEQQRTLELQGAEIRSLQSVQDRVQKLNLVQSNRLSYLSPLPDQVALLQP